MIGVGRTRSRVVETIWAVRKQAVKGSLLQIQGNYLIGLRAFSVFLSGSAE
jgi:hypothetical protein